MKWKLTSTQAFYELEKMKLMHKWPDEHIGFTSWWFNPPPRALVQVELHLDITEGTQIKLGYAN